MRGLTDKQQEILDFIEDFTRREGMSPTVYEVGEYFKIRTPTAFAHIRALQKKGYVDRSSKARSLTLLRGSSPKHMSLTLSIPLLGRISAGLPLFAEENKKATIHVDPGLIARGTGGHRLFGLEVVGMSMQDAGILDGDTLIIKESKIAELGDIVIALVDKTEATCKYFYHAEDQQIELRPANDDFKSQFYNYDEVEIQGVLVGLNRRY